MQGPRASCPVKLLRFRNQRRCVPCSPLPDRARIISVVKTPKCQADETDAAEAVEEFHVEVTDYMVLRLCFRMIFVEHYVMAVSSVSVHVHLFAHAWLISVDWPDWLRLRA